jgi:hypothetical protein
MRKIGMAWKVATRSAPQAAQTGREGTRRLAEQIGARVGQLAGLPVPPLGADGPDAVDPGRRDVAAAIAHHDRGLGADHAGLEEVGEQVLAVATNSARARRALSSSISGTPS